MSENNASFLPASRHWPLAAKLQPPVKITTSLTPWFDVKVQDKALSMIRDGGVVRYLFYRNGAGVVFDNGNCALVLMPPNSRMRQGYSCRGGWCSACKEPSHGEQRCIHVAAAVLLGLGRGTGSAVPLPLFFPRSPWHLLGRYLCGILEREEADIVLDKPDDGYRLTISADIGLRLTLGLTVTAIHDLLDLFPDFIDSPAPDLQSDRRSAGVEKTVRALFDSLVARTRTANEHALNNMGSRSKGERQDSSRWMELARLLCMARPDPLFVAHRGADGLFFLETQESSGAPLFQINLPRSGCAELLDELDPSGALVSRRPAAGCFSEVSFTPDRTRLKVNHCVRLDDGRSFSLQELAADRYGNYYYLDKYGFFSTIPLKNDEKLHLAPPGKQLSLFTAATSLKEPETGFVVESADIPGFLELNKAALQSGCHQVAPEVSAFEIVRGPERLELKSYEEIDDWCYLAGYYELGNQAIDLAELLRRGGRGEAFIAGAKWLQLADTRLAWFHELGEDRICPAVDGNSERIRLRRHEMLALAGLLPEIVPPESGKGMRQRLKNLLDTETWFDSAADMSLPHHLRTYQRHGVVWLKHLVGFHLGGILADDMGLGKTHQALTLLDILFSRDPKSRHLVVCPTSVLLHWRDKAEKFFPELRVSLYYGTGRDLEQALQSAVVVTTYGVMRNDISLLSTIHFQVIFFDEMQHLKNMKTGSHQAALKLDADSLIGLTGTPLENSVQEVKALFDICLPGMFSTRSFRRFLRNDSPEMHRRLSRIVKPFILRRTRGKVLGELPPVIKDIRLAELHDDQVGLYRQIIEESNSLVRELLQQDEQANYIGILTAITRLKQVCDHPCLLGKSNEYGLYGSGKWELWKELVDECLSAGFKVVVFSQFTAMLDIMARYLEDRSLDFCQIRGGMTPRKRQQAIDRFQTDDSCSLCLASLLAGGVGIDLTAAQVVIHYDRWWNPAKEEQATARVHRMGQRSSVQVIKLVTVGTLEEKIHALIEKKQALADDIITEDDASIMKQLNRRDIASLLSWQE